MTNEEITTILAKYDIADEKFSAALSEIATIIIERAGSVDSEKALNIERQIVKNQNARDRGLAGFKL